MSDIHVVVLAAGKGTRMKSALPKVLHVAGGRRLIDHALAAASTLSPTSIVVVVGHEAELLKEAIGKRPGLSFDGRSLSSALATRCCRLNRCSGERAERWCCCRGTCRFCGRERWTRSFGCTRRGGRRRPWSPPSWMRPMVKGGCYQRRADCRDRGAQGCVPRRACDS